MTQKRKKHPFVNNLNLLHLRTGQLSASNTQKICKIDSEQCNKTFILNLYHVYKQLNVPPKEMPSNKQKLYSIMNLCCLRGYIPFTFLVHVSFVEIVFLQCRFDLEDTDKFVVRDIANRGPLIFNGTKMRALGFFNERQFWLEDDETEFHVRAFYKYKWITGYLKAHKY